MTIDVLFGDAADMEDHDAADAGALGLYYVAQACPEDGEYDICGHFLCIVDVPANLATIRDNLTDAASIQAAAVTAPHEIIHAVQFALQTGGRTPIQVFDEDGEDAFFELARRRRDDAGSEDEAERLARASTDHLSTHRLEALLRKTVDS